MSVTVNNASKNDQISNEGSESNCPTFELLYEDSGWTAIKYRCKDCVSKNSNVDKRQKFILTGKDVFIYFNECVKAWLVVAIYYATF